MRFVTLGFAAALSLNAIGPTAAAEPTAAAPFLVQDLALGENASAGSYPQLFVELGDRALFVASNADQQRSLFSISFPELEVEALPGAGYGANWSDRPPRARLGGLSGWRRVSRIDMELLCSDGSPVGTRTVYRFPADFFSYVPPGRVGILGGAALFGGYDPDWGEELWRSDCTESGTYRVADLAPGSISSSPRAFVRRGPEVCFLAFTTPGTGLYCSDGTTEGTTPGSGIRIRRRRRGGREPAHRGGRPSCLPRVRRRRRAGRGVGRYCLWNALPDRSPAERGGRLPALPVSGSGLLRGRRRHARPGALADGRHRRGNPPNLRSPVREPRSLTGSSRTSPRAPAAGSTSWRATASRNEDLATERRSGINAAGRWPAGFRSLVRPATGRRRQPGALRRHRTDRPRDVLDPRGVGTMQRRSSIPAPDAASRDPTLAEISDGDRLGSSRPTGLGPGDLPHRRHPCRHPATCEPEQCSRRDRDLAPLSALSGRPPHLRRDRHSSRTESSGGPLGGAFALVPTSTAGRTPRGRSR